MCGYEPGKSFERGQDFSLMCVAICKGGKADIFQEQKACPKRSRLCPRASDFSSDLSPLWF